MSAGATIQMPMDTYTEIIKGLENRIVDLEDWVKHASHHLGCSGGYPKDAGGNRYRCKCGMRELLGDTDG